MFEIRCPNRLQIEFLLFSHQLVPPTELPISAKGNYILLVGQEQNLFVIFDASLLLKLPPLSVKPVGSVFFPTSTQAQVTIMSHLDYSGGSRLVFLLEPWPLSITAVFNVYIRSCCFSALMSTVSLYFIECKSQSPYTPIFPSLFPGITGLLGVSLNEQGMWEKGSGCSLHSSSITSRCLQTSVPHSENGDHLSLPPDKMQGRNVLYPTSFCKC